jgi:ABC-type branched-subunit amino acid transport system ATPase component
MLRLENIRAGYGKKEVLHGVSFVVPKAKICAVLGPNGAGKSTLLKVIAGMIRPVEGKIYFEGEDMTDLPVHERVKKGIGYFMQGGQVFPSLSVLENLEIGANGLPSQEKRKAIEEVMELFPALQGLAKKRAGLLSGGQRQQLALGMILVKRPKLLLLDEPSAGLPPNLVKEIMQKIQIINQTFNITIVLVEQNIKNALDIANKVLILTNGQLQVEYEEPQKLIESGELEEIFFSIPTKIDVKEVISS